MTERVCQTCGGPLNWWPGRSGKRPNFCSDKCRKASYGGTCVDCGARTSGGDGPGKAPKRCVPCTSVHVVASGALKVWTRERILAAIREWVAIYGEVPRVAAWNPTVARDAGCPDVAAVYLAEPDRWPAYHTVLRAFGNWRAAITAAGFTPRERGRNVTIPGPTAETLSGVARLYLGGMTCAEIADQYEVHAETIRQWLIRTGVERRKPSDYRKVAA